PGNEGGKRPAGRPGGMNRIPPGFPPGPGPVLRPGVGVVLGPAVFPAAPPPEPTGAGGPTFSPILRAPIGPARLSRDQIEVSLPGPVGSAVAAAGGRFLLLHVPKAK